jgi:hypothetical protein
MCTMNAVRVPVPAQPPLMRADVVGEFESLRGRRAAVSNQDASRFGFRAASDLYVLDGFAWVDVVTEREWWARELLGALWSSRRWPAGAVWVEMEPETTRPAG